MAIDLRPTTSAPLAAPPLRALRTAQPATIDDATLLAATGQASLRLAPVRQTAGQASSPPTWAQPRRSRPLDPSRRLRQVLVVGDSVVGLAYVAVAVVAGFLPLMVAAVGWLLALLDSNLKASRRDLVNLRLPLRAGVGAVAVAAVAAVFSGSAATGRSAVLTLCLGTLAVVVLRVLVRTAPVAAVLGTDEPESILLVGDRRGVAETIRRWSKTGDHGRVVAACLTPESASLARVGESGDTVGDVPVLGGILDATAAVERTGADVVAVVPGPSVDERSVRELGWSLESSGAELSVVTPLADVAEHRASAAVVGRQLLVRVRHCSPAGYQARCKGLADRALAGVLLLISAPLLAFIALAVRLDSTGPGFFRQQRVREGGRLFTMLKFRTMHVDADERKITLAPLNDHGDGPLFKMRHDPRVTRLGRILRATSLDELPQLVNVLRGQMSLVGPRPALPSEVAQYNAQTHRRLAVKPGLTGLWQVSGRSNLSWEQSLQLDLAYVDNWRHMVDIGILARTLRAVLRREGAY